MDSSQTRYWHFAKCYEQYDQASNTDKLIPKLGYGDYRPIELGKTLTVESEPIPCQFGLHAAHKAYDALGYVKDHFHPLQLTRVTVGGKIVDDGDKVAAQERTVVAMLTVEQTSKLLFDFALWSALLTMKYYPGPKQKIEKYLKTGDPKLRNAAKEEFNQHQNLMMMPNYRIDAFNAVDYIFTDYRANQNHERAAWAAISTINCFFRFRDQKRNYQMMTYEQTQRVINRYTRVVVNEFERRCLAAIGESA